MINEDSLVYIMHYMDQTSGLYNNLMHTQRAL